MKQQPTINLNRLSDPELHDLAKQLEGQVQAAMSAATNAPSLQAAATLDGITGDLETTRVEMTARVTARRNATPLSHGRPMPPSEKTALDNFIKRHPLEPESEFSAWLDEQAAAEIHYQEANKAHVALVTERACCHAAALVHWRDDEANAVDCAVRVGALAHMIDTAAWDVMQAAAELDRINGRLIRHITAVTNAENRIRAEQVQANREREAAIAKLDKQNQERTIQRQKELAQAKLAMRPRK